MLIVLVILIGAKNLNSNIYLQIINHFKFMSIIYQDELCAAFVAIVQLQKYIMQQDIHDDDIDVKFNAALFQSIEFYDDIPKSILICSQNNNDDDGKYNDPVLNDIKSKSVKLIYKYIFKQEVRLSDRTDKRLSRLMING